jgi:4-amino-4-deoxy-L-arabinose transferase-like glycosyltransferase
MESLEGNIRIVLIPLRARPWVLLAAIALLSRVLLALYLGVWGQPERFEYDAIAESIHAGFGHNYQRGMYHYAAYAPPVWSYVLAFLLWITPKNGAAIQILQAMLCVGAAFTCAALTSRLVDHPRAPFYCGLLVALQPSLLYYSVAKSDPLPLNAFLLTVICLGGAILVERPDGVRSALLGLLVALATLSRGTPAIALPIVAIALVVVWRRLALLPVLAMTAGMALGLFPWLARNAVFVGEPLITSTTGENFWRGNNPLATGGVSDKTGRTLTSLSPDDETYSPFSPAIRAALAFGDERERHHVFMAEAWRFIHAEPAHAFFLFTEKLETFWWRIESRPEDYSPTKTFLYASIYRSELFLAAIGALILGGRWSKAPGRGAHATVFIVVSMMLGLSLVQSAFYVQGRHRFLIEPLLLVFTAIGLAAIVDRVRLAMRPTNALDPR